MKFVAFAFLSILLVAPAAARQVRYPETGAPAVTFDLPDGWTSQPDENHNLLVASGDHRLVISMSMIEWKGEMDVLAAAVLKAANADPPSDKTAVSVLGGNAFAFRSHAVQKDGKTWVNLRLIDVPVDATHAFVCTIITMNQDDDPHYMDGIRFVDKLKLAPK